MEITSKPKMHDHVFTEELDGEYLIFDAATSNMYTFNQTAVWVLHLCTGKHALGDVIHIMRSLHPEDDQEIPRNVIETVQSFQEHNLITLL